MSRKKIRDAEKRLSDLGKRFLTFLDCCHLSTDDVLARSGISPQNLSGIKYGWVRNPHKLLRWVRRDYPEWEVYLERGGPIPSQVEPYTQPPEQMLPAPRGGPPAKASGTGQRDPDQGSYGGNLDLGGFRVVTTIEAGDAIYVRKVQEVLASGESATVAALKANIDQFHEKVQDRKEQRAMRVEVENLKKEVRQLRNSVEPSDCDEASGGG